MRNIRNLFTLALLASFAAANAQNTVYSISSSGDNFTGPSGTSQNLGYLGSGNEQFVYRETRTGSSVGINSNEPNNGNGSVFFNMSGSNVKSEIALGTGFLANGDSAGSLGSFNTLSAWSADL